MDILLILIAAIFMIVGLIGCLLPILPGPPFNYIGLLIIQLLNPPPFSLKFMLVWLLITVVVVALDYVVPIYGTKKYGGSRFGVWGSVLGLVIGLFFFPLGIVIGPILGALIGELLSGKKYAEASKAALGSFAGFLAGTLLKLLASSFMIYYFVKAVWEYAEK